MKAIKDYLPIVKHNDEMTMLIQTTSAIQHGEDGNTLNEVVDSIESRLDTLEENGGSSGDSVDTSNLATKEELETLETSVTTNTTNITLNTSNISTNTTNISTNTSDIENLENEVSLISTNVTSNTSDIESLTTNLTNSDTRINTLETTVSGISDNVGTLTTESIPELESNIELIGASKLLVTETKNNGSIDDTIGFGVSGYGVEIGELMHKKNPNSHWIVANGTEVSADDYPRLWDYLQMSDHEDETCTFTEWQEIQDETFTLSTGATISKWNGVGGVNKYGIDLDERLIKLPDLRGMYLGSTGIDNFTTGDTDGDMVRNIEGYLTYGSQWPGRRNGLTYLINNNNNKLESFVTYSGSEVGSIYFDSSRTVPTGNYNKPRTVYIPICIYVG